MSDFQTDQQRELDGSRDNAQKFSSAFKKKRFYLDNAAYKTDFQGENQFPFQFKSFWVVDTNNTSFVANMVVNPKGDGGDPLPLRFNMSIPFKYRQNGCALEWAAQSGVWIDIVFAFDSDILPGYSNQEIGGDVALNEGSAFVDAGVSIANVGTQLLAAVSTRKVATFQNTTGAPMWIGSLAKLNGANYQTDCERVDSGDPSYKWKNKAALYARFESTTHTIPVREEA